MGSAVFPQHVVGEILDSQAQPRDAQFADRLHFRFRERARFALEGHFLGVVPGTLRRRRSTRDVSCLALRKDGVPPPK